MGTGLVVRPGDRESFQLGSTSARVLVAGEDTGGSFAIVVAPIAAKALAGPVHTHHKEDALWYVLEGEFAAQVGDKEIHEPAGSVIFAPRGIPHTYWNPGSTPATYLEMAWPAGLERYLEAVGQALIKGGDDLLSKVGTLSDAYGLEFDWDSVEPLMQKHGLGFAT
jgi:mannose-6-phosphate isomerase-like protein (cupin superfamily)